jgi:predicted metal-dependent enzyme (double-stranded beta helix superfamily)
MRTRLDQREQHPAGCSLPLLRVLEPPPEPVRLEPDTLLWLAELYGSSCVTPWSDRGEADPTERVCELVELSFDFEIWAIHWPQATRLQLHDHGGASGALWVVHGSLTETVPAAGRLQRHSVAPGSGIGFGPHHIHEVNNLGPSVTTSVHVYSPPMARMTFFRPGEHGVVPERTDVRESATWVP